MGSGSEHRSPRAEPARPIPGPGPTLLVIDDDPDLRLYVRQCVSGTYGGFRRVIEAPDGESGLETTRTVRPDVIVCDVLMPGLGGIGLCRRIRADPSTSGIPILLLTGGATSDDMIRQAEEAGADGVLLKPFNARRLRAAVENVLRTRAALESDPGDGTPPHDTIKGE